MTPFEPQPVAPPPQGNAILASVIGIVILAGVLFLLVLLFSLCGCAHYEVDPATGEGSSYGFLRSMTVSETVITLPDGTRTESRTISTQSNTGEVLMGLNEVIGTMVDAASKAKP